MCRVAAVFTTRSTLQPDRAVPQPWEKVVKIALAVLEQADEKGMGRFGWHVELPSVETQEHVRGNECNALVPSTKGRFISNDSHSQVFEVARFPASACPMS